MNQAGFLARSDKRNSVKQSQTTRSGPIDGPGRTLPSRDRRITSRPPSPIGETEPRPLIFVWGEKDGTRFIDNGQWGAKVTALADAKALFARVSDEVSSRISPEFARKWVRMSVVPKSGHNGLHTKSHMNRYLDELVAHLGEAGLPAQVSRGVLPRPLG